MAGPGDAGRRRAAYGRRMDTDVRTSTVWALGDYHAFATQLVWSLGEHLVTACAIGPGQRVLDVAAGTGNVALRAAAAGADVVASDLTPESLARGRRAAEERGLQIEWVEADAEALPFPDASFDVVTSSAGAMFAPDQQAVADELVRVCRPGGTIGLIAFTPDGLAASFFGILGRYAPAPPPGTPSPLRWGDEAHVAALLGDRVTSLRTSRHDLVERYPGTPRDYVDFYRRTFGPVVGTFALLEGEPERAAALDRELLAMAAEADRGPAGGPVEVAYEYLLAVAVRA
jgi:ubiquinone/menaquinone biosynthesis C-methylase UbiE